MLQTFTEPVADHRRDVPARSPSELNNHRWVTTVIYSARNTDSCSFWFHR